MYDILIDEENWCKGMLAQDSNGLRVDVYDNRAVRYDMYGAMLLAMQKYYGHHSEDFRWQKTHANVLRALFTVTDPGWGFIQWQDREETTHRDVLSALRAALQIEEEIHAISEIKTSNQYVLQ